MNPPIVPTVIGPRSVEEFGFRIVIRAAQHDGPIRRLMRCPGVAVNVTEAFWPGTVVVTVVEEPN
jgi:hypothetical protein